MLGGEPRTEGLPDKLPNHGHTRLAAPVPRPLFPEPEWWWIHSNGDPERSALCQSDMTAGSTRTSKSDDRTLSPTPPLPSTLPPTMPGPSHDRDQIVSVAIYPDKDSPSLLCVDGQRRFSACPSVHARTHARAHALYVYIHACMRVHMYECMYVYMYVCKYVCMYVHRYIGMYVWYVCMYVCVCMVCMYVCMSVTPGAGCTGL